MADRLAIGSRDALGREDTPVFDRVIDNLEDRASGVLEIVVRVVDGRERVILERVEISGREFDDRETDSREELDLEPEDRDGVDWEAFDARETDRLVCPLLPPLRSIRVRPAESNAGKETITTRAAMNEYFFFMAPLLGKRLYVIALYHHAL